PYRLLAKVMQQWQIEFDTVDLTDEEALRKAIRDETRVVWVESPSNPLLKIVNIRRCAELAHAAEAQCVVDNTFATPYLQRPLELGADIVVHSVTKYLAGHSYHVSGDYVVRDRYTAELIVYLTIGSG